MTPRGFEPLSAGPKPTALSWLCYGANKLVIKMVLYFCNVSQIVKNFYNVCGIVVIIVFVFAVSFKWM